MQGICHACIYIPKYCKFSFLFYTPSLYAMVNSTPYFTLSVKLDAPERWKKQNRPVSNRNTIICTVGSSVGSVQNDRITISSKPSNLITKTSMPKFWQSNKCASCNSPRKSEGVFLPALVCVSVCVYVCLSVTTITKKIVHGFVPNFTGRLPGGKGRPSSCFVTIGRGM